MGGFIGRRSRERRAARVPPARPEWPSGAPALMTALISVSTLSSCVTTLRRLRFPIAYTKNQKDGRQRMGGGSISPSSFPRVDSIFSVGLRPRQAKTSPIRCAPSVQHNTHEVKRVDKKRFRLPCTPSTTTSTPSTYQWARARRRSTASRGS